MPSRVWLERYAEEFSTVELNVTFYRLPKEETFVSWRDRVPAGFLFAVKASRLITHLKRLGDVEEPLDLFLSQARRLERHLGPILVQTPPRWERNVERLRHFLALLPRDLRVAFEFRDVSWFASDVYDSLAKHGAAVVRVSSPAAAIAPHSRPRARLEKKRESMNRLFDSSASFSKASNCFLTCASDNGRTRSSFNNCWYSAFCVQRATLAGSFSWSIGVRQILLPWNNWS